MTMPMIANIVLALVLMGASAWNVAEANRHHEARGKLDAAIEHYREQTHLLERDNANVREQLARIDRTADAWNRKFSELDQRRAELDDAAEQLACARRAFEDRCRESKAKAAGTAGNPERRGR